MTLPANKTKIVATIGPASSSLEILKKMMEAGLNVARLNFSHGDFSTHRDAIKKLRAAEQQTGRQVAILADLPGPKMRIGVLGVEPIDLEAGRPFTLTTRDLVGNESQVSVSFKKLPQVVKKGDILFLNDGLIQLEVQSVQKDKVLCQVVVGGELRSKKGLNLPGISLGISAFTDWDRECLKFALEAGVEAVSQSFVDSADDIQVVRQAALQLGKKPFVIAKIERSRAVTNVDEILEAADGIMVARGDLGVETPFEEMAILQKKLIRCALRRGKPVITATQMLESMTQNRQPTRAEATDVANAVIDGTDAVMLSGESAMGKYPVEAVATLAKIAAATEAQRPQTNLWEALKNYSQEFELSTQDLLSICVEATMEFGSVAAVVIPTQTGHTARRVASFRPTAWIAAVNPDPALCRQLQFSYGIMPVCHSGSQWAWEKFAKDWIQSYHLPGKRALLIQGPSTDNKTRPYRIEILEI
jgi:pyruvate kinase